MKIFEYKGCKKCKGDLIINSDIYGNYVQCLQCSTYYYFDEIIENPNLDFTRKERNNYKGGRSFGTRSRTRSLFNR